MKKDNQNELLPIVDAEGKVVGKATRGQCHNGRSMLLHPVVHLHVFDKKGRVLLQHRPAWKTIQPNKWDTAVGGHVDYGETIEQALLREVGEEIGLKDFMPRSLCQYVHESEVERELVYVFSTRTDQQPQMSDEVDKLHFFTSFELDEKMGKNYFTPNFEAEWNMLINQNLLH